MKPILCGPKFYGSKFFSEENSDYLLSDEEELSEESSGILLSISSQSLSLTLFRFLYKLVHVFSLFFSSFGFLFAYVSLCGGFYTLLGFRVLTLVAFMDIYCTRYLQ